MWTDAFDCYGFTQVVLSHVINSSEKSQKTAIFDYD